MQLHLDSKSGTVKAVFRRAGAKTRDEVYLPQITLDGRPQSDFRPSSDTEFANESLRITIEAPSPTSAGITFESLDFKPHDFVVAVQDNSSYYGCGERFGSLDHKGQILQMVSIDRPEVKGSVSYKPVPFYMSTRGYALWIDNSAPGSIDLNVTDREHVLIRFRTAKLRLVLIDGPGIAAMLGEFTRLTGRPRVPPAWSFAPWKSRNVHNNREEVLADAELTRKHHLPGSVIVIDSPWETGYNDFTLNRKQFREPEAMFRRLRELGFYVCLWLTPFVNVENLTDMTGIEPGACANFAEGERRGFFVKQPDGKPMIASWWKGRGALVDFTNPAAVNWWHEQIDRTKPWGIHALKCDDGEGNFVQDAVFFDGTPASEMKNRYAALYLKSAQDYLDSRLKGDGVLHARCGFTGTQAQPFCWAGDNEASFSFENGLPSVILAGQNAALSGLAFWGHDIAGYTGTPTKELFIRWTQFGAFSPLMQVHMTSNLGPWDFDSQTLEIYRTFARLHTELLPYILDAAHEAARSGLPIIQPMVLASPDDPAAAAHRYQYLFGPELLVAPMYQPGTHRSVYLPHTIIGEKWIDYWTGSAHDSGQVIEVHVPLERMPLFVRGGAIICMLPNDVDTLIPRYKEMSRDIVSIDDRRVLQIWPGGVRNLQTHEGVSAYTAHGDGGVRLNVVSVQPRRLEVRRMFAGPQVGKEWTYDAATQTARRSVDVDVKPIAMTLPEP